MKKIYSILILLLSFQFSYQIDKLPDKVSVVLKCFFGKKEYIDNLIESIDIIFNAKSLLDYLSLITYLPGMVMDCTGLNLFELIPFNPFGYSQIQKDTILKNVQNANAPLLLKKYLYDIAANSDIAHARKECYEMTKMVPYDKYKNICDLFEFKLE